MTEESNLWDSLMKLLANEMNQGSPEVVIEKLQTDIPEILRFIADYYQKESPDARNEINTFRDCADYLELMELKIPDESFWETRERLGI